MNDKIGIPEMVMATAVVGGILFLIVYSIINWPT
jgi:hypothetical protein